MSIAISVKLKGPLVTGASGKAVNKFIHSALQAIVERGEQKLRERLMPRPAGVYRSEAYATAHGYRSGGDYRRSIHGRVVKSDRGEVKSDPALIYGAWLEGVGTRNQTTRFKGYHSFQNVRTEIDKDKAKIIQPAVAILMKDLRG